MAFTINRYTYTRSRELYSVEVDENYRKELTDKLNNMMENESDHIELLTEQEIKDALYRDYENEDYNNEKLQAKKNMSYYYWASKHEYRPCVVGEILNDMLNDDLWDSFCDTIDSDTDDWEDEIEDEEEEETEEGENN